ncbi:Kynurenine 3-monooxygenase [Bienertia sinuspersici]
MGYLNHMVMAWISNSVSDNIKDCVMFIETAREIWQQLKIRFSRVNGAQKYKLNRAVYHLRQKERPINEYYTKMRKLTDLEINAFIYALNQQKEEQRLFQFLNGLDEDYTWKRSQFLIGSTLPIVESVCATLQQEEAQREI